jgi:signal transduction histidine kinase
LFNAIKYARGSSYVTVAASQTQTEAYIRVTDLGIPLRKEEEENIWDFGFRGQDALERHVNGSGIGLYTVKKIIKAHGGIVAAESSNKDPRIVTFSFKLLKKDILKKTKVL